jgi:hypothetical protein
MKRVIIASLLIIGLSLVGLMPRSVNPVQAASPEKAQVIMGGGTAVLFSNGDLYDLTSSGWHKSGHLPPGVDIKNVKVVLTSNRIVEVDGTGWVQTGGVWRRIPSPNL